MRSTACFVVAFALTAPAPARAQAERARRAFDPAVTVAASVTAFGQRLTGPSGEYEYKNSVGLALWGDLPLTRRTGLLALATLAPLAKQKATLSDANTALYESVLSYSADLGVAARLKATVPVFFFLGGGVHGATHYAIPESDGGAFEPQGTVAIGYDARRRGRWNARGAFVAHVVKPADPDLPSVTPRSTAFDWSFQVGARYLLSPAAAPEGAP